MALAAMPFISRDLDIHWGDPCEQLEQRHRNREPELEPTNACHLEGQRNALTAFAHADCLDRRHVTIPAIFAHREQMPTADASFAAGGASDDRVGTS